MQTILETFAFVGFIAAQLLAVFSVRHWETDATCHPVPLETGAAADLQSPGLAAATH